MANNQKFTLTFDAQLNVNQMKGALSQIQSTLNGLHLPQNIARGLQGTFDKLSNEIQNFEVAIGKDITSKADFKKIENQADKIEEAFRRLKIQVSSLTGLSGKELEKLFPISITQNIKKASSAIEQYSKKVTDATRAVDGQRASIEKTKKDIQIIQNKPLWTDQDQKQLRETGKEITNLQDRAAELKENLKNLTNKKTGQPILEENWGKSPAGREYLKELEEVNKKIEELLEKQKQLDQRKGVSIRAGTQARELEKLNRDLEEAQQKLANFENAKKQIESFGEGGDLKNLLDEIGKLTGLDMSKFTADVDGAGEAIKTYLDQETQKASENVKKLTTSIKNAEQPIKNTGGAVREYGERVDYADQKTREVDALKRRITYFFGLNNTIQLVKRTMKSAISTIKELDAAMTATAVVTDFTVADMWEQLPEYTKRANELGVSTKAAYEAATLYYQQGLKTNEVMAISNETLKMARIAGLDAATATDRVTNAIRGFNMAINEVNAQRINDVYSRLAAISASNVDEISTAMTKVASLANSANMEFETTAAFLAQIVETTRESAETAGTALKTVIARFSEVKKLYSENELRGTDEEGLEIDVNKISTALRTAGIDLNKYFLGEVGLDDIFMELASKWDKLTSVQQRYIATQAAGSRQQSRFIALMSNYARTQELVGEAYNSNGAAAKQFAKTQESLESKLARLKNAWNEFAMGILNSDLVKIGVDILTNLLNFVNQLTSAFGVLDGGIGGVISSLLKLTALVGGLSLGKNLLNGLFGGKLGEAGGVTGAIFGKKEGEASLISKLGKSIWGGLGSLGTKIGNSKLGTRVLGESAQGALATGGTAASLTGLVTVLGGVAVVALTASTAIKIFKKNFGALFTDFEEFSQNVSKVSDDIKANAEKIKTVQSDYASYTEKIDQANTSAGRVQAIKDRNEYITSLLEQNAEYQKYLSTTFEGGQIKLVLDEDAIANAVEKAAEAAQKMGAYADLSSAAFAQNNIKRYSKYIQDFDKLANFINENGNRLSPEEIEKNKAKYKEYERLIEQATSEMEVYAKKGISQLITKGLLSDEVADSVASFLAKNFARSNYEDLIETEINNIDKLGFKTEDLKALYKLELEVEPSDELSDKALKNAIAAKRVFSNQEEVYVDNLERLLTNAATKEPFENMLAAATGKGIINKLDLSEYLDESGNILKGEEFYKKLGFNKEEVDTWKLDDTTQAYISGVKDQIKQQAIFINNIQKVNKSNIFNNLLRSGVKVTDELHTFIKNLNPEQAKAISDITTRARGLLSEEKYNTLLGDLEGGLGSSENLTEIQDFFNNFNLDNPINAFLQLKEAEEQAQKSGDDLFKSLVSDVRESNSAILSTSNLLKTFVQSSEYDELYEDLHKFIEENGRLTPDKINELAKSSKAFNVVLESSDDAVNGLAKALVAIDRGAPLEGFTQRVLESLDSVESIDDALWKMYDTIDNFDAGRAYSEGTEFISKQLETFQELVDKRAFVGPQFKNIGELLFGENFINYLRKDINLTGDEIAALWQERIDQLQKDITYDSFGFMTRMAEGGKLGISYKSGSIEDFDWNIGERTSKELIEEIANELQVSEEVANMILNATLDHLDEAKEKLNENDFNAALENFAADIDKSAVVTQQELDAWAAAFEDGQEKVKKAIEDNRIDASKIVDWTGLSGQEIADKIKESFDLKVFSSAFDYYGNKSFIDSETLIKILQESFKLSPEQAVEVTGPLAETLNGELGKLIQVESFKNGELVVETKLVTGETFDKLQENIEAEYKEADYNILVDALVNADWEKVGNAIVEGILKATSGKNWFEKIINQYEELKKYIEKNPIQINTDSSVNTSISRFGRAYGTTNIYQTQASGDSFLTTPGWALTGEEGPEIVWNKEKGYSYITGQNGPEFRLLQIGDRIFNAQDTSRILKHSSFAKGGIFGSYADRSHGSWDTDYPDSSGSSGGSAKQPTKWRNELDWLYNLMEDIAELERSQTKLQEQHDRYLEDISKTGRDLYEISNEQLNNLRTQLDNQREALARRRQEMAEQLQASGYTNYVWWNDKDKTIEIDWDAIEAIQDKDTYDAVSDLVSKVEKVQDEMDTAEDALWDIEGTIKEIENRYLEEYTNFQKRIYDAVVNSYQEQIDKLSQLNDTLNDSNNAILNSLQHEIELQRQIRDNTDTENNIRDMEARLAYLRRDTTGANESEIRALEKQLDEARQNYADTLIDQSINRLQESNDKAAEQREKQISLLTAQLDYWKETGALWPEVATLLETGLSEDGALIGGSALEQILRDAEDWKAMSEQQREVWANELITSANQAGAYLLKISEGFDNLSAGIWALIPQSSLTTEKYQYATGGLASYTGPAWLDGTPQEPEYVLNARQTDAFLRLAEVLPSMFGNQGTTVNNLGHDIYVEFNMNVDKITSDYDVDRIVDRVKEDIYNISSYRNVNSISFSR